MVFDAPGAPAAVSADVTGKEKPAFILIWEGGRSYTAEYVFPEKTLLPGKSFLCETKWEIREK
jgi:hypothetical protein